MSEHGGLSVDVVAGLAPPKIFTRHHLLFHANFLVRCRTLWVAVIYRGFVSVVLGEFSMAIVLSPCLYRGEVCFCKDVFDMSSTKL